MMNLKPHSNICQYGLLFARMPQNFNYSDRHELKLHHHYWKIRKLRKKTLIGKSWKYSTIVENTYTKYIFHPYNLWSSSLNLAFSCSLFILKAAVTNPDSGVHASGSNLIFAGVSNLSNFAVFATCRHLKIKIKKSYFCTTFWIKYIKRPFGFGTFRVYKSLPSCAHYEKIKNILWMNASKFIEICVLMWNMILFSHMWIGLFQRKQKNQCKIQCNCTFSLYKCMIAFPLYISAWIFKQIW